jgi:hypothetical protein
VDDVVELYISKSESSICCCVVCDFSLLEHVFSKMFLFLLHGSVAFRVPSSDVLGDILEFVGDDALFLCLSRI